MTIRIDRRIVKAGVADDAAASSAATAAAVPAAARTAAGGAADVGDASRSLPSPEPRARADVIQMHERLERPERLIGATYKIRTTLSEHALYVTINDVVLNAGTEHEMRRPFEIFINSKNMEHFQWIVALTRIISAVFRKGGDVAFLVEELHSVFDPRGGYFKPGGKYIPSLVAEIGTVIEDHLVEIGLMEHERPDEHRQRYLAEKRGEVACKDGDFPADAKTCRLCSTRAVVMLDGCMTCLSCGDSKCG